MVAQRKYPDKKQKTTPIVAHRPDLKVVGGNTAAIPSTDEDDFNELAALLRAYNEAVRIRHLTARDGSDESREVSLNIFRINKRILRLYWRIKYPFSENDQRVKMQRFYEKKRRYEDENGKWHEEHTMFSLDNETYEKLQTGAIPKKGLGFIYDWGENHDWPELCLDEAILAMRERLGKEWPYGFPILYTIAAGKDAWHALSHLEDKRKLLILLAEEAIKHLGV